MQHQLGSMKRNKSLVLGQDTSIQGINTNRISCHFCKGNLHRNQKDFAKAKQEYNLTLELLINEVKVPSHVRTCACL